MRVVDKIGVAGFLHDLGKFRQRAGLKITDGDLHLYAPSHRSHFSHIHAAHTGRGLEELGLFDQELINWAAKHHLSTEELGAEEQIIQLADRFASRLDRRESDEPVGPKEFLKVGIETPFSYTYLKDPPKTHYYPVQKLKGIPEISPEKLVNSEERYRELYLQFREEIRREKPNLKTPVGLLKLKSIFEKYTTFIPSSTYRTYPDVSLFDHSLATGAIAVAIYNGDWENFSLIQGDFTSIQTFIFTQFGESRRKLGKIFRAKSLFVSIATEIIALKIVESLNLSIFNIVMNAGGKFTILSHRLKKEDREKLVSIRDWVNREFQELNYLETKFAIGSIDFTSESFKLGRFSEIYKQMATKLEREKLRFIPPFNQFKGYLEEAKGGVCSLCGMVPTYGKGDRCRFCEKFEEIGRQLVNPQYRYLNFKLDALTSIHLSKKGEGLYYFDLRGGHPAKRIANYVATFSKEEIKDSRYRLVDEESWRPEAGGIKSFYHLAVDGLERRADGFYGRKYLAVLKADIDNLGKIFICGFHSQETFSRLLYLSRMIDYFFTEVLMEFVKGKSIYTLFAGGDDLFLIGHYRDILESYQFILTQFPNYTRNPNFHLSSSIYLFKPAAPVHLIAQFAEEELERAKGAGKNRVAIFGQIYTNREFLELIKYQNWLHQLYTLLRGIGSGSRFFYRLYAFLEMAAKMKRGEELLESSRWLYLYHYSVEKLFQEFREGTPQLRQKLREELKKLKHLIEEWDLKFLLPLNLFLYSIRKYQI
ncbi:MAG: type III-A CRISPR-associated protein Cas10/Csm1 [Campylobacterales bacterium]